MHDDTFSLLHARPAHLLDARLGFVAQLCLCADSALTALACATRFRPLWTEHAFSVSRECELIGLRMPLPEQALAADMNAAITMIALWLQLIERVRGRATRPVAAYLPASCDAQRASARAAFDCGVYFDRPFAALMFRADELEEPNVAHEPSLFRLLRDFAEDKLAERGEQRSTCERVCQALRALDDVSDASAESVAAQLGMGVRTLHRRLRVEGTSYRHVVAEFRMQRCVAQLSQGGASAKKIAYSLGFASPASFHRAFKRWTGRTVGEYRRDRVSA